MIKKNIDIFSEGHLMVFNSILALASETKEPKITFESAVDEFTLPDDEMANDNLNDR